jgi:hypothetical protein
MKRAISGPVVWGRMNDKNLWGSMDGLYRRKSLGANGQKIPFSGNAFGGEWMKKKFAGRSRVKRMNENLP